MRTYTQFCFSVYILVLQKGRKTEGFLHYFREEDEPELVLVCVTSAKKGWLVLKHH